MSHDSSNGNLPNTPLAKSFQDAYQKAVTLQRIDEQLIQLSAKRKQLVDELRHLQGGLNDEFARLISGESFEMEGEPRVSVSINADAFNKSAEREEAVA